MRTAEIPGIFSDIMNLKDSVRLSDSADSSASRASSSGWTSHTTERSEQWSVREIIWTRSALTAVYGKHLCRMLWLPELVVVGDVKGWSPGILITDG